VSLPDLRALRGGATPRDAESFDAARLAERILATPDEEHAQRAVDLDRAHGIVRARARSNDGHALQALDRGYPDA